MGENAVLDAVAPFFSDHPMLIVICGFVPLVAILVYCLWTKPVDAAARRKKTDEHTPDNRDIKKQKCRLEEEEPNTKQDNSAQESEDTQEQSTGQSDSNSRVEGEATEQSTGQSDSNSRVEGEATEQSTGQSDSNSRVEAEATEQSTGQSDSNSRVEGEATEQSTGQSDSNSRVEGEATEQSTGQSDSNSRVEGEATEQSTGQSDSNSRVEAEATEQSTGQSDSNSGIEAEATEQTSQMCESPPKDSSHSERHSIHKKPVPPPVASKTKGRAPVIIEDSMQQERTRVSPSVPPSGSQQNEDAPSIRAYSPAHDATNSHKVTDLVSKFQDSSSNDGKGVDPDIKAVNGVDHSQLKVPTHSPLSDQWKGDAPTHQVILNGWSHHEKQVEVTPGHQNGDQLEVCQENGSKRWSFPPKLEEFNLMESDVDPAELESYFTDDRLTAIDLTVEPDGLGLGISIVGGSGSPNGDLPIIIKRILPGSLAEKDGKLKSGDELIAVNDTLLVGMRKDFTINTLSNIEGPIRLLVLQEDD